MSRRELESLVMSVTIAAVSVSAVRSMGISGGDECVGGLDDWSDHLSDSRGVVDGSSWMRRGSSRFIGVDGGTESVLIFHVKVQLSNLHILPI